MLYEGSIIMNKQFMKGSQFVRTGRVLAALVALPLLVLVVSGCNSSSDNKGKLINQIELPTDTLLNLSCKDAGIAGESCVLDDRENPFALVSIREFDINNEGAENKFELNDQISAGPTGAKARFYLWATAQARSPSGENQYRTALALHELFTANNDPLIRDQALRAYRSVLDNYFGSVTFFDVFDRIIPASLNEIVASGLFDGIVLNENEPEEVQLTSLLPPGQDTPLDVLELLGQWGYTYQPDFDDTGLVFVNQ